MQTRSIDAQIGSGRKTAGATVTHGWKPESGFLKYRWEGYDEALLLYILALGSPTHPLPRVAMPRGLPLTSGTLLRQDYLYAGPLFTHQLSHIWIDFRGIQDAFMRDKGIDYFENSRRATYAQQQYAINNPLKFEWLRPQLLGNYRGRWPRARTRSK